MLNNTAKNIFSYLSQGPVLFRALAFFLMVSGYHVLPASNFSGTSCLEIEEGSHLLKKGSHLIERRSHISEAISDHDFHVSVMRVDYNPETMALEVTLKLFTDDIEKSLEGLGAPALRLGSPRELPESDTIFSEYLNNRLAFFVDDQQMAFNYLGKEVELDNTTWCYIEVTGVKGFNSLRIRNQVLMELFDDQTNLVNIFAFGEKKSLLLRGGQPEDKATF